MQGILALHKHTKCIVSNNIAGRMHWTFFSSDLICITLSFQSMFSTLYLKIASVQSRGCVTQMLGGEIVCRPVISCLTSTAICSLHPTPPKYMWSSTKIMRSTSRRALSSENSSRVVHLHSSSEVLKVLEVKVTYGLTKRLQTQQQGNLRCPSVTSGLDQGGVEDAITTIIFD